MKPAPTTVAAVSQAESTYEANRVEMIYAGSDGEATQALYDELAGHGPIGVVAVNLMRAQKCSARAKVYRSGHYSTLAYGRKNWSLAQLAAILCRTEGLGITFGWGTDAEQPRNPWVFYVDLPNGQVSFHAPVKGEGPMYAGVWDGVPDASTGRVLTFVDSILHPAPPPSLEPTHGEQVRRRPARARRANVPLARQRSGGAGRRA